jgi:hypothetical protein
MSTSAKESLDTIESFVQEVGAEKSAAEAHTEAGGYEGPTTHAVKDVDDRTETADEGARSSENTEDVKDPDIGPGEPSVDATGEAKAKVGGDEGTAAKDHIEATTNVQATGDDPSNETSGTKNTKDDDGYEGSSSHPARTDNSEIDGHKYARDLQAMPLEKLAAHVGDLGNQICADLATAADTAKQAMDKCPGCSEAKHMCKCGMYGKQGESKCATDAPAAKHAADDQLTPELAKQVGWEMAGLVTGNFDKQAADKLVEDSLTDIVKTASDDADNVIAYLHNYFAAQKQAQDAAAAAERQKQAMPMGGQPAGDPGGLPPEAMAAMGGGAPGGEEDPMAAMAGGGGEGGMPPGAEGGMPGGEPDPEQLAQVLDQLGISPEELQEALAAEGGGGEMGGIPGDPMAAGGAEMPPEAGAMEAQASATPEAQMAKMSNYVREVVSRSRQKKAEALAQSAANLKQ